MPSRAVSNVDQLDVASLGIVGGELAAGVAVLHERLQVTHLLRADDVRAVAAVGAVEPLLRFYAMFRQSRITGDDGTGALG